MSENDGAARARALQAWWDNRNAPAAAPVEVNANDRASEGDAASVEPLVRDASGDSRSEPPKDAETSAEVVSAPEPVASRTSGATRPKRDAPTEAAVPADAPPEIKKAPKRGKNADGETVRDVVLAMTESEMHTFAADMALLQRTYGTRNLAATLLRAVGWVADAQRKLEGDA